jgi:hypothetical protein
MDDDTPKLSFDILRRWIGNRTLSDRIWTATGDMRRKLDDYLTNCYCRGPSHTANG